MTSGITRRQIMPTEVCGELVCISIIRNVFLSCFNHGLLVEIQITRRSHVDKITFYPFWYNSIYRDLGHFVR